MTCQISGGGVLDVVRIEQLVTTPKSSSVSHIISCPAGRLVGGGYDGSGFGNEVFSNHPFSPTGSNGWRVGIRNNNAVADLLTNIYVLCIDATP